MDDLHRVNAVLAKRPELQNVIRLAQRLAETPPDQGFLALDRINDLQVAIWEWERRDDPTFNNLKAGAGD